MELQTIKDSLNYSVDQVMKTLDQIIGKFPDDQLKYKPHPKSMAAGQLSCHVYNMCQAYISGPINGKFHFSEFDEIPIDPRKMKSFQDILSYGNKVKEMIKEGIGKLREDMLTKTIVFDFSNAPEGHFTKGWGKWELSGSVSLFSVLEESIHHRGQLNLYLRLLGIDTVFVYG